MADSFSDFGLRSELLTALSALGFEAPTTVQNEVIPQLIKDRRDCLVIASTGTGKTAAYGLPLLNALSSSKTKKAEALVVCPTRELCNQIAKDLRSYAKKMKDVRVLALYGGADIHFQMVELSRGASILVATPGRLIDLMNRGVASLDAIRCAVLDEADEMLQMGFKDELESIMNAIPEKARTWMFSATMDKRTRAIANKHLTNPIEVNTVKKEVAPQIRYECIVFDKPAHRAKLLDKFLEDEFFFGIAFIRTRDGVRNLSMRYKSDTVASIRGDMDQKERDKVMKAFKNHQFKLLLATDVAARGIDIDDVSHVIHYDMPDDLEAFTHRSGRTARAGKSGMSILFASKDEIPKALRFAKASKVFMKILNFDASTSKITTRSK